MTKNIPAALHPGLPASFGAALRFLRKRAHLTQDELGLAVGYSREQVARLENESRLPDLAVIAATFVPVLFGRGEWDLVEQFLALAGQQRAAVRAAQPAAPAAEARQAPPQPAPPASRPDAARHQPPAPLLPMIGRSAELHRLLAMLQSARLLNIVGAPGIGKTRLALETANAALGLFRDGAAFVSLAALSQPAEIPYAVLNYLSITPAPMQTVEEAVRQYLAPLNLLLVLDNCEHVLDGMHFLDDWLTHAPRLKLLCTSRTSLDLYGEVEYPLAPLPTPDLTQTPDLESWGQSPAMQLLLQRAQAAAPDFNLQPDNLLPLATLCVALDGLPLALELAAARLRDLSPELLAQQLVLRRGPAQLSSTWLQQSKRNIAERHRTLQAAVDWSVRLLPSPVQVIFCRLGVFSDGCSEEAAAAVTGASLEQLTLLARANLIGLHSGRVQILETLRVYALERLMQSADWQPCQGTHAQYYAAFSRLVFKGVQGAEQDVWMRRAILEHENCQSALRWALAQSDGALAVELAGSLWWFWYRRGLFILGRQNLSAALQLPSSDLAARANAFNGLANFCLAQEDFPETLKNHQESLALRHRLEDPAGIAVTLHNLGLTSFMMGDYANALDLLGQSVAVAPEADPTSAWAHMGLISQEMQDLPQARHWLELAYQRSLAGGEGWEQAFVLNYLADVLRETGDLAAAAPLAEESRRIFAALDDSYYLPDAEVTLAQIAFDRGDDQLAWDLSQRTLLQYEARSDWGQAAGVLLLQAELACRQGSLEQAANFLARSLQFRRSIKRAISVREQAHYSALEQRLKMGFGV